MFLDSYISEIESMFSPKTQPGSGATESGGGPLSNASAPLGTPSTPGQPSTPAGGAGTLAKGGAALLGAGAGALLGGGAGGGAGTNPWIQQGIGTEFRQAAQDEKQGKLLESYLTSGLLPPGEEAALKGATAGSQAGIRSGYTNRGMAGSSAEAQDIGATNVTEAATQANIAGDLYKIGASQVQMGHQEFSQALSQAMQQDQEAQQASQAYYSAIGSLIGGAGSIAASFIPSDRRLKTDISPVGFDAGTGLMIYSFRYTWDLDQVVRIGFMADEVEKVAPWAVCDIGDGYKGVDYAKLGWCNPAPDTEVNYRGRLN